MRRRQRLNPPGGVHHVMNRGVDRADVFFADVDRVEFGRRLADIHDRCQVSTLAYCLMDNHYHLLLQSPNGALSPAMQRLSSIYTRHTNDRIGRDGPLFRGRFHAIPVTTDAYLLTAFRYVHRNALDLPGISSCERYRWSSMRAYLGLKAVPGFLDTALLTEMFDGDARRLAAFTARADWSDAVLHPGQPTDEDARTLRQLIALAGADDDLRFGRDDTSPRPLERAVLVLIEHGAINEQLASLAAAMSDYPSPAARKMALSRARKRHREDPTMRRTLDRLRRHLHPAAPE